MDINDNEIKEENDNENTEIIEADETLKEDKQTVCELEYDVKNDEEEKAFLIFQKKFVYKRNWKITVAFGILAVIFSVEIFRNPKTYLGYVLCFISLAMIFITWYNTRRIRKYLMEALKPLEDDKYTFSLYDDSFKIETIVSEEEKNEEGFVPIKPRIVNFSDISLNIIENDEMFIIILKKETIYVLPKRCIENEKISILEEKFTSILGEDFTKE